jgi:(S)-ureidoglycine aminohydrolase
MSVLFGSTRAVLTPHYAVLTPQGLVNSVIPGWSNALINVLAAPPLGARFTMVLAQLDTDGAADFPASQRERFVFVRSGAIRVQVGPTQAELTAGGYGFLPAGSAHALEAAARETRLLVFEKEYLPLPDRTPPLPVFANEREMPGVPFLGDEAVHVKQLLPDQLDFDMAVNIMAFQPGGTLPIVETHVMEHGLLMLEGQGIYRLGSDWYPVQADDSIWMGPYCPQWFVAAGKEQARYILYKDVNRDLLAG